MDVEQYITTMVEPTIAEFRSHPASTRHAFLACLATYHTIDYISHPQKPSNRRASFSAYAGASRPGIPILCRPLIPR